jgi:glyoxylase-like metal-dependent hydrolase (beta-lactamase superfamily II)
MYIHRPVPDVTVLTDQLAIPGIGHLPVNAFVLHAAEPVVVDTGLALPDRAFLEDLGSVLDPADVRWIWLTHPDRDHTGGLVDLLAAAPHARVITPFLGVGILSTECPLPMDRVFLLNPGQEISVGDRRLRAFRPPLFDSPATTAFQDLSTGVVFSSDCFGAALPTADLADADDVRDVPASDLQAGQLLWATVDSPWVHVVDPVRYRATIDPLRRMAAPAVLSSHLPPALACTDRLLDTLLLAPQADPFVGPDQRALEEMLASFEPAAVG